MAMGDFNGDGKLGLGDIISLVIGGIVGLGGLMLFGMLGIVDSPDMQAGFITAVIVVFTTGFVKGTGILGKLGGGKK